MNETTTPGAQLAALLQEASWLLSSAEIAHALGYVLLIGPIIAFDLRLIGLSSRLSIVRLARHQLPLCLCGIVLLVPSGLVLFISRYEELIDSRLFAAKLILIALNATIALIMHNGPYRSVLDWSRGRHAPHSVRLCATLSLLGWCGVIVIGHCV